MRREMVLGDVIDEATRQDGLMLKILRMDSGTIRIYMCNPPGRIEAREYKTLERAKADFQRIKDQEPTR